MNIKYYIALMIGFFVTFLTFILNIFLNIRYGMLYSSRVGHLCYNIDGYLSSRKKDEIAIFGHQKRIANLVIFNLWKRKKNLFFSKIGFYGYFFLREVAPESKMLIKWREYSPKYKNLLLSRQNINLDKDFLKKGKNMLLKNKIKSPFVCLHNRDEKYLKKIGSDKNDHFYRNHDFNKYSSSIDYLIKKNCTVVRISREVEKQYNKKSKNFISMTQEKSNDFNDLFLISQSKFLVSQTCGVANISALFRKKQLLINVIPFQLTEFVEYPYGSLFIPKKLFDIRKKRFLKLHEMADLNHSLHERNFYKKRGLKVIENNSNEIRNAIEEIFLLTNKRNISYKNKLQEKFWNSMTDKKGVKLIREKSNINICNSFLKNNKSLI